MLRANAWRPVATGLSAILYTITLGACATDVIVEGPEEMTPVVATGLDGVFELVGAETGVPADLLEAIGYVETRWQMVEGDVEHDGAPPATGLMAIKEDVLAHAAQLAGLSEDDVRLDPESNVRAAAALLDEAADTLGLAEAQRGDLGAWAPAVAEYSRIADAEGRASYVLLDVYRVLLDGATETAENGELVASLPPHPGIEPDYEYSFPVYAADTDHAAAIWSPSPNHSARPTGSGGSVEMVIIHTCEGSYSGCVSWLRNTAAGASAHYVVKENGAQISQLVREARKAWHIAATYKCSLNSNVECGRNGTSSNNFTVGIEHAGFASQASWASGLIEASAKLTCDITKRHTIARDRQHIVGHGQLQPYNRVDPGANWPWSHYIERVKAHCDDGGTGDPDTGGTIIVDSNNANNDATKARMELAGTWTSSNASPGYYGSGYWWAQTEQVSAPATFYFYMPAAGTRTIDAWWVAGTNRSTSATFVAQNASGTEVGRVAKNQQSSGSQWVTLGTWNFSAGWNKVMLSRWAAPGSVVVADAIRVR
jgi:N-acetyl-anhydromuramyl-L-alanine amidase AmpD